jgi:hypothetical protein
LVHFEKLLSYKLAGFSLGSNPRLKHAGFLVVSQLSLDALNGALFGVGVLVMLFGILFSVPGMGGRSRGYARARGIGVFSGPI